MEITSLMPDTEVYFEYNNKITKGIFKDLQRTNAGKLVKKRNRLVQIINKKGNKVVISVSKETKFFDTEKSYIEYEKKLNKEKLKRQELAELQYLKEMENFKKDLYEIENINHLPISCEINNDNYEYYCELFNDDFSFKLKDDTEIQMTKYEYKCILHNLKEIEGIEIYKINDGELFICFDCGELLVNREDLIEKYTLGDIVEEVILFPKSWSESRMIEWIKKLNKN